MRYEHCLQLIHLRQSVIEFENKSKIVKAAYLLEGTAQQPL